MSNLESSPADKTAIKEAINCSNDNAVKDKPNAIKRSFSTPQSPLKIEQQKRGGPIATNVSISFIIGKDSMSRNFGPFRNLKKNQSPFFYSLAKHFSNKIIRTIIQHWRMRCTTAGKTWLFFFP